MRYFAFYFLTVFALVLLAVTACNDANDGASVFQPTTDFVGQTGLVHDPAVFEQSGEYWVSPNPLSAPPAKWDLRDKAKVFPNPGDQGNCGSCWAYSTHQGLEIWRAVNLGILEDLSAQTVLSCSDVDAQNWGCGGGTMGAVAFLKRGLPLDSDFTYKAQKVSCKYSSAQLNSGWPNKIIETPWVGESLSHSRYWKKTGKEYQAGDKIAQIQQAMWELNSPAIVTVDAYGSSSDAVVSSCAAINSQGNHMVNVIGWDDEGGNINGHVYNSWGAGHGKNGISRIKWSCGAGKLNHGLGVEARVIRGDSKPPCDPPGNPNLKAEMVIFAGTKVELGRDIPNVKCTWSPTVGLKNPNSCLTDAQPEKSTEYHLEVANECGKVTAMTYVRVFAPVVAGGGDVKTVESRTILTPFGEVDR